MSNTCSFQGFTDCNRKRQSTEDDTVLALAVFFPSLIPLRLCAFMFFLFSILGLSCLDFLCFLVQSSLEIVFMLALFFMCLPWLTVSATVLGGGDGVTKQLKLKEREVCWEVPKSQQVITLLCHLCFCGLSVEQYKGGSPASFGCLRLLSLFLVPGMLCRCHWCS